MLLANVFFFIYNVRADGDFVLFYNAPGKIAEWTPYYIRTDAIGI